MGVHVANGYIRTSNKGTIRQVFSFAVGAAGAVGTVYQAGANFVLSVTKAATGRYTVQLNKLYPVRIIGAFADINTPAATDPDVRARIDSNSYSSSTGSFDVLVSGHTAANDTAQVAADPADGARVVVELVYVDQTTGIAN